MAYANPKNCYNNQQVELMNILRKLWEQHVMWTRSFIISTVEGLDDLNLVTERLLRNPEDFANELIPFYGSKKSNQFAELLSEHLLIAAKLLNDAKAGGSSAVSEDRKKWYENADEIAAFLAGINLYWDEGDWQAMLYEHLKLTENEAIERLKGQYVDDIMEYDHIEDQALEMADLMFQGINQQFRI